jgi:hypothetical protein
LGLLECLGKGGPVDIAGKMDRTLAINGIPAGRIGRAEVLHLQTDTNVGALNIQTCNLGGRFPGRSTRGTTQNMYPADLSLCDLGFKLGRSESFAIFAQTNLPG